MKNESRQLTLGETIAEYADSHSNKWYIDGNTVMLKLAREDKPRNIGLVIGRRFVAYRKRDKHLLRKNESYGFNIEVLRGLNIEYVDLTEDDGTYRIPFEVIVDKGEYLFFKEQGFEKQLFLPIRIIQEYKFTPDEDIRRIERMGEEWFKYLKPEFDKHYMLELGRWLSNRRLRNPIYPESEDMFRALKLTPYNKVKVVILGQDPYHTPGVADGLAFSSKQESYIPPSLLKVFDAIDKDFSEINLGRDVNLTRWAEQGVLLLNKVLTVEKGQARSHYGKGWEIFTQRIFQQLSKHNKNLVVLLWGAEAGEYEQYIDNGKHLVLKAEHPAYAHRQFREWDNKQCFYKCNQFLTNKGYGAIEW